MFLLGSVAFATGDIFATFRMAFAAVGIDKLVADINRVDKVLRLAADRNVFLNLIKDIVA
jgi:coenzyme F420-reducing hydrogenase delta subunit